MMGNFIAFLLTGIDLMDRLGRETRSKFHADGREGQTLLSIAKSLVAHGDNSFVPLGFWSSPSGHSVFTFDQADTA